MPHLQYELRIIIDFSMNPTGLVTSRMQEIKLFFLILAVNNFERAICEKPNTNYGNYDV